MIINIFFGYIYSNTFIAIRVPYGIDPPSVCEYFKYQDTIATDQNIGKIYNVLNRNKYENAYIASHNGDYSGYTIANTGEIKLYDKYQNPTKHAICETHTTRKGPFRENFIENIEICDDKHINSTIHTTLEDFNTGNEVISYGSALVEDDEAENSPTMRKIPAKYKPPVIRGTLSDNELRFFLSRIRY